MTLSLHRAPLLLLSASALLLTGCPNPNTYGTPRTTPPGKVAHSIAVETFTFRGESEDPVTGETYSIGGTLFMPPSYNLRIGAVDRLDVGVRVSNASSIGADLKWNFIKGDVFDMAIDPAFQWFNLTTGSGSTQSSLNVVYVHTPLLLGFNLDEAITAVLAPGLTYGFAGTTSSTADLDVASSQSGPIARLSLGFDFRLSQRFALHPEVSVLRTFEEDTVTMSVFGLGFNFGNLPSFGPEQE